MIRRLISVVFALALGTAVYAAPDCNKFDWKARWITKAQCNSQANSWIAFRKIVDVGEVPSSLEAKIAADTKYWLWINGVMAVFEGGLKRGPAPGDGYYDVVDIAPYLRPGANNISILLWHLGKNGFSHLDSGTAGLLFEASGDGIEILSDGSWEANELPAFSDASTPVLNYRLPETSVRFDARKFPADWYKPGRLRRMGSALELPFKVGEAPFGNLVERPIPLWKDYGLKDYESVERRGDTLVCKLPYNCQMTPYLKLEAPSGQLIRFETDHAEVTETECVRGEYVTSNGQQEYEHLCWMNGDWMYYILPQNFTGVVKEVKYRETGYDTELSGWWRCDDEMLNEYWRKGQRTLYVDMRDTYYDCPDRERAQWIGDEANELGMAFHMLSPSSWKLALKGMYEVVNWQKPTGEMYGPVPAGNWVGELPMQTLAFVGWYGFREYAFSADDYSFVAPLYGRLHRYLHEVWQLGDDGLPIYREGGWDWPDAGDNCDSKALLAPWYYLALKAESEFALKIGRTADVAENDAMMANIAVSYNAKYWNGVEYRSEEYDGLSDDRVQAMAVVSGIASPDKYPALLKVLDGQDHATTYMHRHVLDALCIIGHPELAQEKMHRLYPTIMTDDGTTLWEHWNFDGTNNHAWSGCGAIVMGRRFAGIAPVEAGYRKFSLAPQMGALKHVETGLETAYGMIELTLDRKGGRIDATIVVPEGTSCIYKNRKGREVELTAGKHMVKL